VKKHFLENMGKYPHLVSYRKFSHGNRAKINGGPQFLLGPNGNWRLYDQISQTSKLFFNIFFTIIHVLSAHYQYAKFHNDSLINKKVCK